MSDGAVCLAYVHHNQVAHSWHQSVLNMLAHDISGGRRLAGGGMIASRYGTGGIVEARNKTTASFLDGGTSEWLLWTDTDMGFAADSLDRLLDSADPVDRPIVGALCFSLQEFEGDGMGGWRTHPLPTLFRWAKTESGQDGLTVWTDYPRDQLVEVAATGSAFILIHRDVLVKLREQFGPNWYTRMVNESTGQLLGEDLSFCVKATACGLPVFVDTRVKTTHEKTIWVAEEHHLGVAG